MRVGGPRVLLFDIEIAAGVGYAWRQYEVNIIKWLAEQYTLSFAWKWLGQKQVHVLGLDDVPGRTNMERNAALMRRLHALMMEADIIVAHNGGCFDDKQVAQEFARLRLPQIPPHLIIDTLKVIRTRFRLNSNRLDDACRYFGLPTKVHHIGFVLWERCMVEGSFRSDGAAWRMMKRYNAGDVVALEALYLFVRPWMTNHPNMNPDGHVGCPICRGTKMKEAKRRITAAGLSKVQYQCQSCGKYSTLDVKKQKVRILPPDLKTALAAGYTWRYK